MSADYRVLIVDDEPDLADLYASWLPEQYAVVTAYDGRGALDALDGSVNVVLLDRRMPGMSGDEVVDVSVDVVNHLVDVLSVLFRPADTSGVTHCSSLDVTSAEVNDFDYKPRFDAFVLTLVEEVCVHDLSEVIATVGF